MSHSSTEAEVISLGAGLRTEGFREFTLSENVLDVLEPPVFREGGDTSRELQPQKHPNIHWSPLLMFHEAAMEVIMKGRSPHMRHVAKKASC